jgi:hypothetical protein
MWREWPKLLVAARLSTVHEISKKKDGDARYEIAYLYLNPIRDTGETQSGAPMRLRFREETPTVAKT